MQRTRPRAATLFALLSLPVVAIAAPALAQGRPQPPEPPLEGSARITGRVLAADNGTPVRRALVRLSGLPAATQSAGPRPHLQRETETDDNGAFDFADLPGGSYHISVYPTNGFLGLARPTPAVVAEGQPLDVRIRLERTGAIEGRIADSHGEGLVGVEVLALRRNDFRGHVTLMPHYGSRAATNDLGQFRLFNLSPGEYVVVATPVHVPGHFVSTRRSGFATTYYPGTRSLGHVRLVVVRAGADAKNVNFSLATGPLARVAIEAVDSMGQPLGREASATLNPVSDVYLSSSMRQATRQDDGRFVFADVPPGDYYLIVSTSYRQEEAAYVNVTVDGDVTLRVQTNAGGRVSGRFVVRGAPLDSSSGRPNVAITATRPPGTLGPSYAREALARPRGTDRFELTGLRGPMVLHAEMSGALLVSISRGGRRGYRRQTAQFHGHGDYR